MSCDRAKSQIFGYVDAELGPQARDQMERHLAGCSACRSLVEQELSFRETYLRRLRPDPAPPHVLAKVDRLLDSLAAGTAEPRRRPRHRGLLAAAALLLVVVGLGLGAGLQALRHRTDLLAELTEASVEQHLKLASGLLPPDIAAASAPAVEDWFRQRLDFKVHLPDIQAANLSLLGARISHLGSVPVAAVEYRLDQRNVSLFVIPDEAYARLGLSEKPKFKMLSHRGYDVIIWRQHGAGYALVSELGARSCLVCHTPEERLAPVEPISPGRAAPPRRIDS